MPRATGMMETQAQDFGMRIWFLAQESGERAASSTSKQTISWVSSSQKRTCTIVTVETRVCSGITGDSGISFPKLVKGSDDQEQFVVFGQKLRRKTLKVSDTVEGSISCELPIRGRHKIEREGEELCNYPLLERTYARRPLRRGCAVYWTVCTA